MKHSTVLPRRLVLFLLAFFVAAAALIPAAAASEADTPAKSEIIFGQLGSDGAVERLYAVNHFTLTEKASFTDYGRYESVARLVEGSEVTLDNDTIEVTAEAGRFYYQGNLNDTALPWTFRITYELDGRPIEAAELYGQSGELSIDIDISEGDAAYKDFFEHYLLQLTVSLPFSAARDVTAENGATALEGDATLVNFIAIPKQKTEIKVHATVSDFSMPGIRIAAIPLRFDLDLEEIMKGEDDLSFAELTDGVKKLADGGRELVEPQDDMLQGLRDLRSGLKALTDGGRDLKDGADSLGGGLADLTSGISQYGGGVSDAADGAVQLRDGARQLAAGLDTLYFEADTVEKGAADLAKGLSDLSAGLADVELPELPEDFSTQLTALVEASASVKTGLESLDTGLAEASAGLDSLKTAGQAISDAVALFPTEIPPVVSAEEWALQFGLDMTQPRDQQIAATLAAQSEGIAAVTGTLIGFGSQIGPYIGGVAAAADGIAALSEGLTTLSTNYAALDQGIGTLVTELTKFTSVDFDISGLQDGVSSLAAGMDQFSTGLSAYLTGLKAAAVGMSSDNAATPGLLQGLEQFAAGMLTLSDGSSSLKDGAAAAEDGALQLAGGVSDYVGGVNDVRRGVLLFGIGLEEYLDGVVKLSDGLNTFETETDKIDETFRETIEEKIKSRLGGDFTVSSFVSARNRNVEMVQFVFITAAIDKP